MSGGPGNEVLQLKEEDVIKFLLSGTHLGSNNVDHQMRSYVYKRKPDGVYILNLRKTWEKILLAARIIVAIENPQDVCVISARPYSQRAILKFAAHTGATPVAGRFTPGTFTNQIQAAYREPRLLIVSDPRIDHQAITEASYVNIPVIALCNTDSPVRHVDVAIPCNNKGAHSSGLMWWLLAREVLRMRGTISRDSDWEVMVDLYFYRDPEEAEKEEATATAAADDTTYQATQQPAATGGDWGASAQPDATGDVTDWAASSNVPGTESKEWADSAPTAGGAAAPAFGTTTDWGADDWGTPTPAATSAPAPAPAPAAAGAEDAAATTGGDWGSAPTHKEEW